MSSRGGTPGGAGDVMFSVIIPSYNSGPDLESCLEGLKDQEDPFEVIVVESGDPAFARALVKKYPGVRFVLSPRRLFSGQARNVGAAHALGGALIFLDADCRPAPGWLEAFRAGFERGYEVVSGSLDNGTPDSLVGTAEYLVSHSSYSPAIPSHTVTDATAASGNMLVRKEAFEELGGFAGTMRANDFIFSRKVHLSGKSILFWPAARVSHKNCTRAGEFLTGQVARGYWNGVARMAFGVQGSTAARIPPLAFAVFPVRLYRLLARCARYRPVSPGRLAQALPVIVGGLLAWSWGFFRASLAERSETLRGAEPLPEGWAGFEVLAGAAGREGAG